MNVRVLLGTKQTMRRAATESSGEVSHVSSINSRSNSHSESLYHDDCEEEASYSSQSNSDDLSERLRPSSKGWSIECIRTSCGSVVNSEKCQMTIISLIVINSIMMGLGTFDFVTENPDVERAFQTMDKVFLIIFTVEITLQFIYRGFGLFCDGWLVFDLVIIIFSWSFDSLQIVRAFRIFRALRLVARIAPLRKLILALFAVLPRMTAITLLLLIVFYIFAVLFTALFKDLDLSDDYFSRLDSTLLTLMQMMTMEWIVPARECMAVYYWAWIPFVGFVMVSGFIVFNLIVAVVCDAVAVIEREERDDEDESLCEPSQLSLAQQRIDEMSGEVTTLLQKQKEIQVALQLLAQELYALDAVQSVNAEGTHELNGNAGQPPS